MVKLFLNCFSYVFKSCRTKDGVVRGHDGLVVTVPTVMWVKVRVCVSEV